MPEVVTALEGVCPPTGPRKVCSAHRKIDHQCVSRTYYTAVFWATVFDRVVRGTH